jgi:hypothetical protein
MGWEESGETANEYGVCLMQWKSCRVDYGNGGTRLNILKTTELYTFNINYTVCELHFKLL